MFDKSAARYVSGITYDPAIGKVFEGKRVLTFDEARLQEEERFDGYYVMSTSEMDKPDPEILDMYKGLWKIEKSFRVSKTDLESRPLFSLNQRGHRGERYRLQEAQSEGG